MTDETGAPDGVGRFNHFNKAGSIYWTPSTGSWSIHGLIRDKYLALGGPSSFLGYPITDESGTPDGVGRFNHFSNDGSIYWTPSTGAWSIHGAIRAKWAALGWERSFLGYPITDESGAPDGVGRFNHFTNDGSIYWTPSTGAWSVHGAIRAKWASMGFERSCEGYPVTDEFAIPGGRQSNFQNGTIAYNFSSAHSTASCGGPPPLSVNSASTYKVAQEDGPGSINQTDTRWDVYGADLGHMFVAPNGQIALTFGDTFGGPAANPFLSVPHADYRSNTMALINPPVLPPTGGLPFSSMVTAPSSPNIAKQLLAPQPGDVTVIPTYGATVGSRMYLDYMSVQQWGAPGHWTLNNSGMAYSDNGGQSWTADPNTKWPGNSNFGQVSMVQPGDGFLYLFGIPGGRYGPLQLARVATSNVLNISAYQYWNGLTWVTGQPGAAVDIAPDPVGELSVQWNSFYQKWLMTYLVDPTQQVVLRMSNSLTGPWSAPQVIVDSSQYPQLYAPYITPLWDNGPDIYFNMSVFIQYQVYLMHTSLTPSAGAAQPNIAAAPSIVTSPRTTYPFAHGAGSTRGR